MSDFAPDARVAGQCAELGLGSLLATTWPNFARSSGYLRSLPYVTGVRVAAVVDGSSGLLAALVLPRIEAASLTDYRFDDVPIVLYGDFHFAFVESEALGERHRSVRKVLDRAIHEPDFSSAVERALTQAGATTAPVGCDDANLQLDLQGQMPHIELRDARHVWKWIRRVKTAPEIDRLRRSASITETVERELFDMCHPGVTSSQLRAAYERRTCELGGIPGFWSTGAGPHAALILDSSPRPLRSGDLVRFDFGCTYEGYWSDTGRSLSLGEPPPEVRRAHAALRAGVEAGFAALRPGVTPAELYDVIMGTIRDTGLPEYARHHVGHSIGADMYDADFVDPSHHEPIEVGMVLNLEVPVYEVGGIALQIEDTAVVTANGYQLLTSNPRDLVINNV